MITNRYVALDVPLGIPKAFLTTHLKMIIPLLIGWLLLLVSPLSYALLPLPLCIQ